MENTGTASLKQIAKILDLSPRRVTQLASEGIIPKVDRNAYPVVEAVHGYIRHLREVIEESGGESISEERRQLIKVKKEREQLELDIRRGEYIPRKDVIGELVVRAQVFRADLLSIPIMFPPGSQERAKLHKKVIHILETYSKRRGVFKK